MERAHGIEYRRIRVPYVDIHSIPIVILILVYIRMHALTSYLFECEVDDGGHRDVSVLEADPVGSGAIRPITVDGVSPGVHVELELCSGE